MLSRRLMTGWTPAHAGPITIAFQPDHLERGDQYINITFDGLDESTITKDASSPPQISVHANKNSNHTFAATQPSSDSRPQWIAGEGVRLLNDGVGVVRHFVLPSLESTMDFHYLALLIKVDWSQTAHETVSLHINGIGGSNGRRWPSVEYTNTGPGGRTILPRWYSDGGYHGPTFATDHNNFLSIVSTISDGVVRASIDGGPIQSNGSNVRAHRQVSGHQGARGTSSDKAFNVTENYVRLGSKELTDAEIHAVHGWLHWNRLGSGAGLHADSPHKSAAPTSLQSALGAETTRRAAVISASTEITPITPDETFSYQQTLAFTGDTPDGFTQTFECTFLNGASDITYEASGAGPFYAPAHPPVQSSANYGGNNVSWAAYNDATAIQTDVAGVKLGVYRVTSGAAALKSVSISSMNHEGTEGFWQKHGYFECDVKLDTIARTTAEPEIWAAPMWMLSRDRMHDRSMVYGEADFPELYSKDPDGWHGSLHEHDPAYNGQPGNHYGSDYYQSNYIAAAMTDAGQWNLGSNGLFDGQFHKHGVLFDPDQALIISYLDRREVERRPYPSGMQNMEWFILFWNHILYANITNHDASMTWMGPHFMTINYVRAFNKAAWA